MPFTIMLVSFDSNQTNSIKANFSGTSNRIIELSPTKISIENIRKIAPDITIIVGDSPEAIESCGKIRAFSSLPIVVTTLKRDSITEVAAMKTGADDYVEYDQSSPTLQIKIQKILLNRGIRPWLEVPSIQMTLDLAKREFTLAGIPIHLTRTEFELLRILMENQDRVVDRRELIDRLWGGWQKADHVLEVHISRLRSKISKAGGKSLFQSVRGIGYRLH